ncbi:hypothetical protein NC653_014518 [Populus alba x Populus x berolinensis]|uniref:Reverse transcriptase zinc-binding domain-containing protein n=1 Tax=Populus alba x Populus x berolinensis TaxID=444605 RepID=A0AAD6QYP8_9ROSI|nr:hypothetical protein NC653_014518 [Populus alba x Populus x berolinensis]
MKRVVNPICVLCKVDDEDRNHLFFTCIFSKRVWLQILQFCRSDRTRLLVGVQNLVGQFRGRIILAHQMKAVMLKYGSSCPLKATGY